VTSPLREFACATTKTVFPALMSGRIFCTRRGRVRSIVSWRDSDTGMQLGFKSLQGRERRGEERGGEIEKEGG
jgi:hypothetical protein